MIKKAVVYIFYDSLTNKYLFEKRTDKQTFAGLEIFPGGKVETDEDLTKTLLREIKEEIGVDVIKYFDLKFSVVGEIGHTLYPYLITEWNGKIPDKTLDRNAKLEWLGIYEYKPKLESVRKILEVANDYVSHNLVAFRLRSM